MTLILLQAIIQSISSTLYEQNQILSAIVVRHGGRYEADLKVVVAAFVVPPSSNVPG